jgi:hypothetical protein
MSTARNNQAVYCLRRHVLNPELKCFATTVNKYGSSGQRLKEPTKTCGLSTYVIYESLVRN